jgi:hypothetical protein
MFDLFYFNKFLYTVDWWFFFPLIYDLPDQYPVKNNYVFIANVIKINISESSLPQKYFIYIYFIFEINVSQFIFGLD